MPDLNHYVGGDLSASANGDLLLADGIELSKQAVLRRLTTNPTVYANDGSVLIPGDYIFHPDYGAGLPRMVGKPIIVEELKALITSQMFLEDSVMRDPAPVIKVATIPDGIAVSISYIEADSRQQAVLSFTQTSTQTIVTG